MVGQGGAEGWGGVSEADAFFAYFVEGGGMAEFFGLFGALVAVTAAFVFLVAGVSRVGKF